MYKTYLKTFERMGVRAIPVKADTGPIGGDLSHEFQILADTGESEVFYDPEFDNFSGNYTDESIAHLRTLYAASEEMHDPVTCPIPAEKLKCTRGIEVGHIFFFGTKYTQAMGATVTNDKGEAVTPQMGSYGIGVSRTVAAIIEASHDDKGIIWPEQVAPFRVGIINMKPGHAGCDEVAEKIYQSLEDAGQEVFYDDRVGVSAGTRFADMDLIGLPWQVILGPRSVEAGHVELKNRKTGERKKVSVESLLSRLLG
jgi:prolyl-tRNA synthetase